MTEFGLWVKAELKKREWPQETLARQIGMAPTAMSRALNGQRKLSHEEAEQIKRCFDSGLRGTANVALLASAIKLARAIWIEEGATEKVREADEWIERLKTDQVMIETLQAMLERRRRG